MKKNLKEILILLIQLFSFYIFPLLAGSIYGAGMVLVILVITFILSIIFASISNKRWKKIYPLVVSILFIPTVFIYYNESALIHALWYFIDSTSGMLIGNTIYKSHDFKK